jgi:poly(beta-D-mannuronate) lyase
LLGAGVMVPLPPTLTAATHTAGDAAGVRGIGSKLQPGDTLILKDGLWRDADLLVNAIGTREAPITLRSATPGGVVLTGNSRLRLGGAFLQVEGLWFHNALPEDGDVVAFRVDSKTQASHSRLTQCAITQDVEVTDSKERKWVSLYGEGNRVDHCHFEGKTSKGTLLVVWLEPPSKSGEGSPPVRHQIEACYFGPRPRLGSNGGEILRIGDSASSFTVAECRVAGNVFERCDGEVEIISNKSCGNRYENNVFRECQGTLTLRHGNACTVVGNVFFGQGRKHTGGIRVIGEDHVVEGNYLEKLRGQEARAALCVMNGIQDSPLNGYSQVKRARLLGNYINDCTEVLHIGYADKDVTAALPPVACLIEGNRASGGTVVIQPGGDPNGIVWKDNGLPAADASEVSWPAYLRATGRVPLDEAQTGAVWKPRPKPPQP